MNDKEVVLHRCGVGDIAEIQSLAKEIWIPAFEPILSADRLDYLFDFMYDTEKLRAQLLSGSVLFYIVEFSRKKIGYGQLIIAEQYAKLEKLYIAPAFQGKGLGFYLLKFLIDQATVWNKNVVRLQVNRGNTNAVRFYRQFGFKIIESKNFDVGNGHVMDDYVMEIVVSPTND